MLRVSVLGCGYWGKNLVRNFSQLGVLHSVCDLDTEAANRMSAQHGAPLQTFEQILRDPAVNAVVIAVPPDSHFSLARQVLLAGKHVFVEKPLALAVEEAEQLTALAEQKQLVLMVGHILQYHPAFLELKSIIRDGALGSLQYIYSNRLNLGKFRVEENILWNFAPHDMSMVLSIVDELPQSVFSSGHCHLSPNIHDVTITHLSFKSGIQGHVFVSWLHPHKEQKLVVVGDRGMAVFDDCLPWSEKLTIYPNQVQWVNGTPYEEKSAGMKLILSESEPLRLECQHFLECIEKGTTPKTDGREGARVLKVLAAAQESLATKQNIEILPEQQNMDRKIDSVSHA